MYWLFSKKWSVILIMLLVVTHIQQTSGAILKLRRDTVDYEIQMDYQTYDRIFQCLEDTSTEHCLIVFENTRNSNYKVWNVQPKKYSNPEYSGNVKSRMYDCTLDEPNKKLKCSRTAGDVPTDVYRVCPGFAFVIQWKNELEYFRDESMTSFPFNDNIFAYTKTDEQFVTSTKSSSSFDPVSDVYFVVLICISVLILVAICVAVILSVTKCRRLRRQKCKPNVYNSTEFNQTDRHLYNEYSDDYRLPVYDVVIG